MATDATWHLFLENMPVDGSNCIGLVFSCFSGVKSLLEAYHIVRSATIFCYERIVASSQASIIITVTTRL